MTAHSRDSSPRSCSRSLPRSRSRRPPFASPSTKPRCGVPASAAIVTVVGENQVLEVVGRQGDWLEVVVPANSSQDRRTALISIRQVTVVSGTLPPDGTTSAATPGSDRAACPLPDPGQRPGFALPSRRSDSPRDRPSSATGHGPSRLR